LYSPDIIRITREEMDRACSTQEKSDTWTLWENQKKPLGRPRHRQQNNIIMIAGYTEFSNSFLTESVV
jgi:hypothetical protein